MKPIRLAFAVALTFSPALLQAASSSTAIPPPAGPSMDDTWPATLHHSPSTGITLGALHVQFEQTTLERVLKTIGTGQIAHHGDAGNSVSWLCYTVPNQDGASRMWLTSGEMGGGQDNRGQHQGDTPDILAHASMPIASGTFSTGFARPFPMDRATG